MPKCKVISAESFSRALRKLKKRHVSILDDVLALIDRLEEDPETGIPLGGGVYKIRLAISSKRRGKSSGARVITYYMVQAGEVYLLAIYDKSDQSTISEAEIHVLVTKALSSKSSPFHK